MAIKYESSFLSEADGLEISVLALIPTEKQYRGIVQLVHGMCENKERYLPFMEYLAQQGFVSVIHDHRGHGESVKSHEDWGYMYGGGSQAILMDILTVNRKVKEYFPELPLILFGHSMGSLAVRAFASKFDEQIDMLIVCGTPAQNSASTIAGTLAKIEGKLCGDRHKSKLLTGMAFSAYEARFQEEHLQNAWLCSDPAVVHAYNESPKCGFLFSDDAFETLFQLMKEAYDADHFQCTRPHMPILFISGEDDPCMENVRKFAKAVQNIRHAGYLDVKGKIYPGMRHEILNEIGQEKVYHDIVWYIQKKLKC